MAAALTFIGVNAGAQVPTQPPRSTQPTPQQPTTQQPTQRMGMPSDTSKTEQKRIISQLLENSEAEIRATQEALEKSRSEQVREYAHTMREEHVLLNKRVREIAKRANIEFTPEEQARFYRSEGMTPGGMGAMGRDTTGMAGMGAMRHTADANFDSVFLAGQVSKLQATARMLEQEAQKPAAQAGQAGGTSEVHTLVHERLPKVQEHMRHAQMLASSSDLRGARGAGVRGDTTGMRGDTTRVRSDSATTRTRRPTTRPTPTPTRRDTTDTRRDTTRTRRDTTPDVRNP